MKRTLKSTAAGFIVAVMAISGCGAAPAKTESVPVSETGVTQAEKDEIAFTVEAETSAVTEDNTIPEPPLSAEVIVSSMTLEQKISQMIMITLRYWTDQSDDGRQFTTALNEKQKALLSKYDFGGICLFGPNITDTEQTVRLTAGIQAAALESENGIPMLISADQEGGDIIRISTGSKTCGNMALGAAGDAQAAYQNAVIMGSELNAVGINTDFAPVLDVNNNPANPVIHVRSFSSDPELVSELGNAFMDGLADEDIISTLKHFPGHGDTNTDSHTGLPKIDKSLDELKATELVPFAAAADKADMIMTAHIQFPQIESETYTSIDNGESITLPATLSKTIITDILRGDLGFDGVVITDAMLMDAIKVNFDRTDSAVLAINAGVDMLLEPLFIVNDESVEEIGKYIGSIADAVKDGRISEEQIDDSVTRIIDLKIRKGLIGNEPADVEEAVKTARTIVGSKEHHDLELGIAEKAITLVKNDDNTLPLKLQENEKVAYFYPFEGGENTIAFAFDRLKADGILPESVAAECHCVTEKSAAEFEDVIKDSAAVILAVETYRRENMDASVERGWQAVFADQLIETAHKNNKKVVLLSMQLPYDAARYTAADALLCAYCAQDMPVIPTEYNGETQAYGVNYPAALITVFGGNVPTGKLPVDVPKLDSNTMYTDEILYPFGYGLTY